MINTDGFIYCFSTQQRFRELATLLCLYVHCLCCRSEKHCRGSLPSPPLPSWFTRFGHLSLHLHIIKTQLRVHRLQNVPKIQEYSLVVYIKFKKSVPPVLPVVEERLDSLHALWALLRRRQQRSENVSTYCFIHAVRELGMHVPRYAVRSVSVARICDALCSACCSKPIPTRSLLLKLFCSAVYKYSSFASAAWLSCYTAFRVIENKQNSAEMNTK